MVHSQAGHFSLDKKVPDIRCPYFAHMKLHTQGKTRDILLGYKTYINPKAQITIIDWRFAPIAKIFFNYQVGDEYEEEINEKIITGKLLQRNILSFDNGQLVKIITPQVTLLREENDRWVKNVEEYAPKLTGGAGSTVMYQKLGVNAYKEKTSAISALLDKDQFSVLEKHEKFPLLILGSAGSGKTTVALHRLAVINFKDPELYHSRNLKVIVPERGLVGLSNVLLKGLKMDNTPVATFDDWIKQQGKRLFKDLPERICDCTPINVIKFKRHQALLEVLPSYVNDLAKSIKKDLLKSFHNLKINNPIPNINDCIRDKNKDENILEWLNNLEKDITHLISQINSNSNPNKQSSINIEQVKTIIEKEKEKLLYLSKDRNNLFLDRKCLLRAVKKSNNKLNIDMVEDVIQHSKIQLSPTTEEQFADVDPGRLITVDGKSIDEGTPYEHAQTIDVEDYAILIELLKLKTGGLKTTKGRLDTFTHLIVDEAQDLAPIEQKILGYTIRDKGGITVAGDHAQHIDPTACFTSWQNAMEQFNFYNISPVHLKISYRSTRPILNLAHSILGSSAPKDKPIAKRDGVPVSWSHFDNLGHEITFLVDALGDLSSRESTATIGIITRDKDSAKRYHHLLSRSIFVRQIIEGNFTFKPGIDIVDVAQVKGLEYDYVIIPDANANHYPDVIEARRSLHVAVTRAIYQLWIISIGRLSPILVKSKGLMSRI